MNYNDFCTLAGRNTNYSLPCVGYKFCFLWSFQEILSHDSGSFPAHILISYQLKTRGSHSADIQGFLSVQLSPLRYSALGVLATFTCQVHQLNSGGLPASIWIPFLCYGWKLSPDDMRGNHRAHLICFPFHRSHCPVLPDMQCLKKIIV